MLETRIPFSLTQQKPPDEVPFFTLFTRGGVCSHLSESEIAFLKVFHNQFEDFSLRCAGGFDAPFLYDLLRAYGTSESNYRDLEIFPEIKLDTIVKNISLCLLHRYFITFLLFYQTKPIAFLQVDPYKIETITDYYRNNFFKHWAPCFQQELELDDLVALSPDHRLTRLKAIFNTSAFYKTISPYQWPEAMPWLNFVNDCLTTYHFLKSTLKPNEWVGNISYNLFPKFQRRGLMSYMIDTCTQYLSKHTHIRYIFADRIAQENTASIHVLQKLHFTYGGTFLTQYGPDYHTRCHPKGNFTESCVCFYKKIS